MEASFGSLNNSRYTLEENSIVISDEEDVVQNPALSELDIGRTLVIYGNCKDTDIAANSTPKKNNIDDDDLPVAPMTECLGQRRNLVSYSHSDIENFEESPILPTKSNSRKRKNISRDSSRENLKELKLNSPNESLVNYTNLYKQDNIDHKISDHTYMQKIATSHDAAVTIALDTDSSSDQSESEATLSFSKQDTSTEDIDLLTRKRSLLICKLEWLKDRLTKMKLLLTENGNNETLPDKGQRLHESIREQEVEIEKLTLELEKISSVQNLAKFSTNSQENEVSQKLHLPTKGLLPDKNENEVSQKLHLSTKGLMSVKNEPNSSDSSDMDDSNELDDWDDSHDLDEPHSSDEWGDEWGDDSNYFDYYMRPTTFPEFRRLGAKAQATRDRELALTVDRLKDLHGSLVARPAESKKAEDPIGLKVQLMPHQRHALAWLLWREQQKPAGGVLADDMGLGKTLTMISLIMTTTALEKNSMDENENEDDDSSSKKSTNKSSRPKGGTLVVCPASLLSQWNNEVRNKCNRDLLSVEIYHGTNRESVPKRLSKSDIVITTYNILSREHKTRSTLFKIDWKRVILDEAHIVRNHKSQGSLAVCDLQADKRWALSGTPIQNRAMDVYSILRFLKCSPFDDLRVWKRWVDNRNAAGYERLATVMKTLMLRRTKQELIQKGDLQMTLPEKFIEEIEVKLDPQEQQVYEKVLIYSRTLFAQFLAQRAGKHHMFELHGGKHDVPAYLLDPNKETQFTKAQNKLLSMHADVKTYEILVLLLRLRQLCCHPALIHAMLDQDDVIQSGIMDADKVDPDFLSRVSNISLNGIDVKEEDDDTETRLVGNLLSIENPVFDDDRINSKMRILLDMVKKILQDEPEDKLIIVSQWTTLLDVIASHLPSIKDATFSKFTGNVAIKDRQDVVDSFNSRDSGPRILLLSLTAGGVGLNLVGGNHLLLYDIHWNPQLETQAQDRIYRFGQTKNVYIYKFICVDTIEERVKALQDKKLEIANSVLSGSKNNDAMKLTLNDLKSLFGF